AALWSSAAPTAEAVLRARWRGRERALEIGCGVGLVGLAALARGMQVTFSDHLPQAIQLALYNARRNGFSTAHGARLDWRDLPEAPPAQPYSVILASDILYHRGSHDPVLETVDRFLADDGVCWIGDPGRFNSREFLPAASRRFRVRLQDQEGNRVSVPRSAQYQMFVLQR
ncbi:MAG: methyltransferase domain-containing protein, partial [Pirellulaceae bacterium]